MITCPECMGEATIERYILGLGITDKRCENEDCIDGQVPAYTVTGAVA